MSLVQLIFGWFITHGKECENPGTLKSQLYNGVIVQKENYSFYRDNRKSVIL